MDVTGSSGDLGQQGRGRRGVRGGGIGAEPEILPVVSTVGQEGSSRCSMRARLSELRVCEGEEAGASEQAQGASGPSADRWHCPQTGSG